MPRKVDIGGYFEQLTRRGRGGRRLDEPGHDSRPDPDGGDDDRREPAREPVSDGRRGGLGDALKDVLRRGRSGVGRTADRVRSTATRRRRPAREELPSEGVVHVEYSPRRDGDPDPGEVVWTWVPYEEDPEQGKDRPVVIIGRRGPKLVGIPLTTKRNDREAQLKLGTGGWDPKRRTSYARIWRMLDIDADRTRREGAVLDADRFRRLVEMVDRYYDVRMPTTAGSSNTDWDY